MERWIKVHADSVKIEGLLVKASFYVGFELAHISETEAVISGVIAGNTVKPTLAKGAPAIMRDKFANLVNFLAVPNPNTFVFSLE